MGDAQYTDTSCVEDAITDLTDCKIAQSYFALLQLAEVDGTYILYGKGHNVEVFE